MSEREQQGSGRPKPGATVTSRNTTRSHKEPAPAPRPARRAATAARKNTEVELASEFDSTEKLCQFTLSMRESLHRELAMAALADGMTMRGLIMRALRDLGLDVRDDDLVDRRRR
jgi:hypothetical protein